MTATTPQRSAWQELLRRQQVRPPGRLLCVDPGETTGWALFVKGALVESDQLVVERLLDFDRLVQHTRPTQLVMESYHIYPWRLEQHSGSDVPTLRYIGAIQLVCEQQNVALKLQSASQAKGFSNDAKLRRWGLYTSKRHARDAIRHGVYYHLFTAPKLSARGD